MYASRGQSPFSIASLSSGVNAFNSPQRMLTKHFSSRMDNLLKICLGAQQLLAIILNAGRNLRPRPQEVRKATLLHGHFFSCLAVIYLGFACGLLSRLSDSFELGNSLDKVIQVGIVLAYLIEVLNRHAGNTRMLEDAVHCSRGSRKRLGLRSGRLTHVSLQVELLDVFLPFSAPPLEVHLCLDPIAALRESGLHPCRLDAPLIMQVWPTVRVAGTHAWSIRKIRIGQRCLCAHIRWWR